MSSDIPYSNNTVDEPQEPMPNLAQQQVNQLSSVVAAIWLATTGAVSFLFLPLIVDSIAAKFSFSSSELGFIAAADMLGMGLLSATSVLWVRKVNWKYAAAIGLTLLVSANIFSIYAANAWAMGLLRFLDGCGGGMIIAIGVACQSDHKNSDKVFSYFIALEMLVMSIGFMLLPYAQESWHLEGVLVIIALGCSTAYIALKFLPSTGVQRPPRVKVEGSKHKTMDIIALCGALLFFTSQGGLWAFLGQMGAASGLALNEVGQVFAVSSYAGIVGALCSGVFTKYIGRIGAFAVVMVGEAVCMFMLFGEVDYWLFMLAILIFQFCWCLCWPLLMHAFNQLDSSGRLVLLLFAIAKLGYTIGPAIIGYLIDDKDFSSVIVFCSMVCTVGLGFIIYLISKAKTKDENQSKHHV